MKKSVVDCSKPEGHPDRVKVIDMPPEEIELHIRDWPEEDKVKARKGN
jgi:hypothetical protein